MTKQEIIDFVSHMLNPVGQGVRFHKEMIRVTCDMVYEQYMTRVNDVMIGTLDNMSKEYMSQDVTLDATKDLYYSDLPCEIVAVPGVSSGIRRINTNQGNDLDFVPVTELELAYMGGSEAQVIDTTIGYWVQGTKIWYTENMTSAIATAGVRMLLLPRFSSFNSSDVINVPGGQVMDFISNVIQLISQTAPTDLRANKAV